MFIRKDNQKRCNPFSAYTDEHGTRYNQMPSHLYEEIADPAPPADFSDDFYYRTEQEDAPYVVYTKKSDEQINAAHNAKIWAQIEAIERTNMFPRQLREFLLDQPGSNGKPWFAKIKAVDDEVLSLKAKLV